MFNDHEKWMRQAFLEAERCKGITGKNPNVGCVIVKGNQIVRRGRTGLYGRPHAEENAIKSIDKKGILKNSSIYLTLEPCAHASKDGMSCAERIAKHRIKEVFVSNLDPDPRTSGKGISILKKAGIKVETNFLKHEGEKINSGFFSRILYKKPFITLKVAISLDGKIALLNKKSKWITNSLSRNFSHLLRSQTDAILTSNNTIINDNSKLTCRLKGLSNRSPYKIVIDRNLKIKKSSMIFKSFFGEKTIIYFDSKNCKKNTLKHNFENVIYKDLSAIPNINKDFWNSLLKDISDYGINNLMIESGPVFNNVLFKKKLIDQIAIFRSEKIIGNEGIPFVGNLEANSILDLQSFQLVEKKMFDNDVFELRRVLR